MTTISISDVETRSGIPKRSGETGAEYLRRVGNHTDLPSEDVEAIIEHTTREQFSRDRTPADASDPPVGEFLRAVDAIDAGDETGGEDEDTSGESTDRRGGDRTSQSPPPDAPTSADVSGGTSGDGARRVPRALILLVGVLVIAGVVVGGGLLMGTDAVTTPGSDDAGVADDADESGANETSGDDADESGANETSGDDAETEVVDSAAEAEGSLEVTDMVVDSTAEPEEEFIELTNVGDVALDMSDWTVRDRENDGAVDARGVDPVTFPDGFVLEQGDSVRIVTGPGEDTEDTVHWGSDTRNWHEDGDVIIVLDGNGDEVLRHEYGSPP